MVSNIKNVSPSLTFLNQMLSLFSSKQITVPEDFLSQACAVEDLINSDSTGLVNSILDFAISTANVNFSIESNNKTISRVLNDWIESVNDELRGEVPTGINALAKEYYRERWKGSSFLVLRSIWEERDGFVLPTKLWFVNGRDVQIEDKSEFAELGKKSYKLKVSKDKSINLPSGQSEKIFVQRPYERWGTSYPVPFLIRRGVYYNAKFLKLLSDKGSNVVGKALEYLLMMKKGDADLAKMANPDFVYSKEDLQTIKDEFQRLIRDMQVNGGIPAYTTNFDTELEHLIPEYEKALSPVLYEPIERRILAGLGFVEVMEGVTGSRRDSIANPKVFISEVQSGVNDFSSLLHDILMTVIEENKKLHRKLTNSEMIQVRTSPLKAFYNDQAKEFLRNLYDRGLLSKRTIVELGADIDFDAEVERRKTEQSEGVDEKKYPAVMYPPITQNQAMEPTSPNSDDVLNDRKPGSPEAKNFNQNSVSQGKDRTSK